MAIFQTPFQQNTGNNAQATSDAMMNDNPTTENEETYGIEWISEYHVACVFLLDTSNSMNSNNAIDKLNEGLRTFKKQTMDYRSFNDHTKACIDVAIVSFGPDVMVQQKFTPVSKMVPPTLTASGNTPMGAAIDKALDMITEHKEKYKTLGTPYYRPWIFCITDGMPNDSYAAAAQRLKKMEDDKKVLGYCVGVENYNREIMMSIFNTGRIFELENLNFPELFKFVSNSLTTIRNSDPNGNSEPIEAHKDVHLINMSY